MTFTFTSEDLATLNLDQQRAIFESMFIAIAIDRVVTQDELIAFQHDVAAIPWALDADALDELFEETRVRVISTTQRADWLTWIDDIAERIPTESVREKVLGTMARLSLIGGLDKRERGVLNAFASAFALSPERVTRLRQAFDHA